MMIFSECIQLHLYAREYCIKDIEYRLCSLNCGVYKNYLKIKSKLVYRLFFFQLVVRSFGFSFSVNVQTSECLSWNDIHIHVDLSLFD